MFVVIEGIEGSGKSTLLDGLAARLRGAGREVVVTREPGGTAAGDAIRAMFLDPALPIAPLTEAMLVNAARAQHVVEVIAPAVARGSIVLCDRFVDSTVAYQGYGRGLDLTTVRLICAVATGGLEPDLTLLLDVPVEVSRARIRAPNAGTDRLEAEDDGFHERVRRGFLELANGSHGHLVLDGTLAAGDVVARAAEAVTRRLGTPVRR